MSGKEQYIEQLNDITKSALDQGNVVHALKAQELIGRARGFFRKEEKPITFCEMAEQLDELSISELETILPRIRKKKQEINQQRLALR